MSDLRSSLELLGAARAGDRRALGRLLTQVETGSTGGRDVLRRLAPSGPRAHLVGLTGPPGAGKSSLASALVGAIRASGRSVAVLAVDPSSPITGGAILGDRVRMQQHAQDPGVFIRSMASRGQAGGLAAATRDAAAVLARTGFDLVLVETVGAGQGEIAVAELVDTTVVVEAPGMGDEVQALKAGLMEMADLVVVSKADLPGADRAAAALRAMLTVGAQHDRAMGDRPRPRRPEVLLASSTVGTGVDELLAAIDRRAPGQGPRPADDPHTADDPRPADDPYSAEHPHTPHGPGPDAHGGSLQADTIRLRPLTDDEDRLLFGIFRTSLDDLIRRQGHSDGWPFDPADDAEWSTWRPLYEHLRATADRAWGADLDGRLVGYARSIRRADDRELTELFVLPEAQGRGIGGQLLERAFPDDTHHRSIIASGDAPALARYLRLGVTPTTTVHTFEGPLALDPAPVPSDVAVRRLSSMPEADRLDALAVVDGQVLGMRRDIDHAWFGERGTGWLMEHAGRPVGYAYTGRQQGPIAVLDPSLVPGAIGLLETAARERGDTELSLWVPLVNTTAVEYLLGRGYRLDPDPLYLLERPVVIAADRYVITSPPFFL